eukprot:365392-Chlamydomonas_euryale.AAC.5
MARRQSGQPRVGGRTAEEPDVGGLAGQLHARDEDPFVTLSLAPSGPPPSRTPCRIHHFDARSAPTSFQSYSTPSYYPDAVLLHTVVLPRRSLTPHRHPTPPQSYSTPSSYPAAVLLHTVVLPRPFPRRLRVDGQRTAERV